VSEAKSGQFTHLSIVAQSSWVAYITGHTLFSNDDYSPIIVTEKAVSVEFFRHYVIQINRGDEDD